MTFRKDSKPGNYDATSLFRVNKGFQQAAERCASSMTPGGAGGTINVRMRIEPSGRTSAACIERDDTGDPALAACVLGTARQHVFPRPDQPGIVNFGTEVRFTPRGFESKARCAEPSPGAEPPATGTRPPR